MSIIFTTFEYKIKRYENYNICKIQINKSKT